jgi:hypothetical protein
MDVPLLPKRANIVALHTAWQSADHWERRVMYHFQ